MNRPLRARLLRSMFLGGFECSSHRRFDGQRLDLIAATGHDRHAAADYRALAEQGICGARDGLRWHLIETTPGSYDWSSARPMLCAARAENMQVIWDLCHYGWPDWLDLWSDRFVEHFSRFAAAAARLIRDETGETPFFCTVNEISYWSWAGGQVGHFFPVTTGRGNELKRQLVRASIAATKAIREAVPHARFLHAEPAIHVEANGGDAQGRAAAAHYCRAQFEALDMVAGRLAPELGGDPRFLDVIGVNFYPDNQWYLGGSTIPLGHHAYRPLRALLADAYARYRRPLLIAETGAEGTAKAAWLNYVCAEVRAARASGVPVEGICLYPILDYPGWANDRHCDVGLFSAPTPGGARLCDENLAEELQAQRRRFGEIEISEALIG